MVLIPLQVAHGIGWTRQSPHVSAFKQGGYESRVYMNSLNPQPVMVQQVVPLISSEMVFSQGEGGGGSFQHMGYRAFQLDR